MGPLLGLMGTLIPLGPGLVGLGKGETNSENQSSKPETTAAGGDPTNCVGYNLVEKIYNNESMNNLIAYIWIKSLCLG